MQVMRSAAQGSCARMQAQRLRDIKASERSWFGGDVCRFRLRAQRLRRQRVVGIITSSWQRWYRTFVNSRAKTLMNGAC